MDKVGGTEDKINDHESFLLSLDYLDKLRKLLYVRVKDVSDKSGADVLFEYDRNTLKKRSVGKGSPIIDACYQR